MAKARSVVSTSIVYRLDKLLLQAIDGVTCRLLRRRGNQYADYSRAVDEAASMSRRQTIRIPVPEGSNLEELKQKLIGLWLMAACVVATASVLTMLWLFPQQPSRGAGAVLAIALAGMTAVPISMV